MKVCLYYGPRRTKDPHELLKADVVLTTYGIMSSEFAKAERGVELIDPEGSAAPVKKGKKATACCLYRIHWCVSSPLQESERDERERDSDESERDETRGRGGRPTIESYRELGEIERERRARYQRALLY